jgi:hypothetical protein
MESRGKIVACGERGGSIVSRLLIPDDTIQISYYPLKLNYSSSANSGRRGAEPCRRKSRYLPGGHRSTVEEP